MTRDPAQQTSPHARVRNQGDTVGDDEVRAAIGLSKDAVRLKSRHVVNVACDCISAGRRRARSRAELAEKRRRLVGSEAIPEQAALDHGCGSPQGELSRMSQANREWPISSPDPKPQWVHHAIGALWLLNLASPIARLASEGRPVWHTATYVFVGVAAAAGVTLLPLRRPFHTRPLVLHVLVYVIACAVTFQYHHALGERANFFLQGGATLITLAAIRNRRDFGTIAAWIGAGTVVLGALTAFQWYYGYLPEWALSDTSQELRAGTGFGEKNYTGALLVCNAMYFLTLEALWPSRKTATRTAFGLVIFAALATLSRGATLALVAGLIVVVGSRSGRKFVSLPVLVGAVIVLAFSGLATPLVDRFVAVPDDYQAMGRVDQAAQGLDDLVARDGLILGIGQQSWYGLYSNIIHNSYIGSLVDFGLLQLIPLLILLAYASVESGTQFRRGGSGSAAAVLAFVVAASFIRLDTDRTFWMILILVAGNSYATEDEPSVGRVVSRPRALYAHS
jgi:hypothetical protein